MIDFAFEQSPSPFGEKPGCQDSKISTRGQKSEEKKLAACVFTLNFSQRTFILQATIISRISPNLKFPSLTC
jgi:hypothetical protein